MSFYCSSASCLRIERGIVQPTFVQLQGITLLLSFCPLFQCKYWLLLLFATSVSSINYCYFIYENNFQSGMMLLLEILLDHVGLILWGWIGYSRQWGSWSLGTLEWVKSLQTEFQIENFKFQHHTTVKERVQYDINFKCCWLMSLTNGLSANLVMYKCQVF